MKKDIYPILIGILIGLLVPITIVFIMYQFYFKNYEDLIGYNRFIFPKLLALCGIANMGIFYLSLNILKKLNIAKGIVISTMFYGFIILIYKLFFSSI